MLSSPTIGVMKVDKRYADLIARIGLTADGVFSDPRITIWRKLRDRENCTLVAGDPPTKFHIKRFAGSTEFRLPVDVEVRGHLALIVENIPTAPLVAYGKISGRRSFVIFADLAGYTPADKLVEAGTDFDSLLLPTATLAAKLHSSGLHHRDLYLCHFMTKFEGDIPDLKLIDSARVARLANPFTRRRWVVKDLAQFWYSTTKLNVTESQRTRWLTAYADARGLSVDRFFGPVIRKVATIRRHDLRLNVSEPKRNVSIPN